MTFQHFSTVSLVLNLSWVRIVVDARRVPWRYGDVDVISFSSKGFEASNKVILLVLYFIDLTGNIHICLLEEFDLYGVRGGGYNSVSMSVNVLVRVMISCKLVLVLITV